MTASTLAEYRAALSEAASAETAAIRAHLAAGESPATLAALDQAHAHLQATRRAFEAAFRVDDAHRRAVRAARALRNAEAAELGAGVIELLSDHAADTYARYITVAGLAG